VRKLIFIPKLSGTFETVVFLSHNPFPPHPLKFRHQPNVRNPQKRTGPPTHFWSLFFLARIDQGRLLSSLPLIPPFFIPRFRGCEGLVKPPSRPLLQTQPFGRLLLPYPFHPLIADVSGGGLFSLGKLLTLARYPPPRSMFQSFCKCYPFLFILIPSAFFPYFESTQRPTRSPHPFPPPFPRGTVVFALVGVRKLRTPTESLST